MGKFLLVCVLLLVTVVAEARGRRSQSYGGGTTSASQATPLEKFEGPTLAVEKRLLERINAERAKYGLKALILDPILKLRARRHCAWMAASGSMVHSSEGAENIAMGQHDTDDVVNSWLNSSGHRANILNPGYTKAGMVGYAGTGGTPFWVQQFE